MHIDLNQTLATILTTIFILTSMPGRAQTPALLTTDDIKAVSPWADDALAAQLAASIDAFEKHGVNTRLRMTNFLAQVMTETGGLTRLDENMNYSFDALMRVFSRSTVSEADARRIAGKPVEVANWVYGNRLGNRGRDTMDGWDYRGSGFIQLTGRDNFIRRGDQIGIDIASDPEVVRTPTVGLEAALAYWTAVEINEAADVNDRLKVRVLVNGPAAHGYEQSRVWFNKIWTKVMRDKEASGFESGDAVVAAEGDLAPLYDAILGTVGYLDPADIATESAPVARDEAIRSLQRENGLPETGEIDEATEQALLDPRLWRHRALNDVAADDGASRDPETTVVIDFASGAVDPAEDAPFESAALPMTESGAATVFDAVSDPTLDRALAARLAKVTAIYPDYAIPPDAGPTGDSIDYGVFGDDDRIPVHTKMDMRAPPASSIVQIAFRTAFGTEKSCSGAMVAPDAVLTAAHCIHSGSVRGRPFRDFVIVPGRISGAANFGECGAVSARVMHGWTSATGVVELLDYDLGIIRLDCDIGHQTGWFGMRALAEDDHGAAVRVQGYASDKLPRGTQWLSSDRIRAMTAWKGFHQADTFGGTSGAPVTVEGVGDMIVGVHSNGFFGTSEPYSTNNGFTRLTPERIATVVSWIEQ
ncbi:MAG: trypsin-like serine protease [Pseudomonadota bacterium]